MLYIVLTFLWLTMYRERASALPVCEFGTVYQCGLQTLDISYKHFKTVLKTCMFD